MGEKAQRATFFILQIEKLLLTHPSLDLNTPLVFRGQSPELTLTLALEQPCCREDEQQLIELLCHHGAVPEWWPKDPTKKSHYLIALENGAYKAAEKILERGATLAGQDEARYGELMIPVFGAALSERFLPPEAEKKPSSCSSFGLKQEIPKSTAEEKNKERVLIEHGQQHEEDLDASSQIEEAAYRKQTATVASAHLPQPERSLQEESLKKDRSQTVARLLNRLLALFQLAWAEGSPAVNAEVDTFPMQPKHPLCDFDLVRSGVQNFATAWTPQWTRDTHCMYHNNLKKSVRAFVLAASVRGLGSSSGGSKTPSYHPVRLDSTLVEKIIGFIGTDQKAWVPLV